MGDASDSSAEHDPLSFLWVLAEKATGQKQPEPAAILTGAHRLASRLAQPNLLLEASMEVFLALVRL
jgi:hypothetical protein